MCLPSPCPALPPLSDFVVASGACQPVCLVHVCECSVHTYGIILKVCFFFCFNTAWVGGFGPLAGTEFEQLLPGIIRRHVRWKINLTLNEWCWDALVGNTCHHVKPLPCPSGLSLYSHDCIASEYTFSSVSFGEHCPIGQVTVHW